MTQTTSREALLDQLDGSGSDAEWAAVFELRELSDLPNLLFEKYRRSRQWNVRAACVYHALRYARADMKAFELGITALADRSGVVRYRAVMLLAYAQKREALAPLEELLRRGVSVDDAQAAIDAIQSHNHHFFVDRKHTGKTFLNVEEAR